MTGWTWVEPFAGAAACTLRLVGGRGLLPPVAWMGGKRRLARAILDAMGAPAGPPARVLLADAGPWGWVWPLLLEPGAAAKVATVLRAWSGEHPRDLWQRLAASPPAEDVHERAAQWLWLQARSASGVPIWWDGWRLKKGTPDARPPQDATNGQRGTVPGAWKFAGRPDRAQEDRPAAMSGDKTLATWRQAEKTPDRDQGIQQRGRPERVEKWAGRTGGMVNPATIADRIEAVAGAFGGRWVAIDGRGRPQIAGCKADERKDGARRTNGLMDPAVVAGRVEALAGAGRGIAWSVHHGDARDIAPQADWGSWCRDAWVYLDPPYLGATGYGWDLERGLVLELAQRWSDAGAVVAISEAVPLDLPGWHHLDLTRGKPEHLTLSRPPARLPQIQGSLFAEGA